MKQKKDLNLYSDKIEVIKVLKEFKKNNKIFYKIIEGLQAIGNFSQNVEIDIYEKENNEKKEYIKVYCCDLDGNIFILCPLSKNKQDISKIEKITNDSTYIYDLSLSKNFPITKENFKYTKTSKIYNFKFGRLITDEKSFYSLFMSDNLGYQIQIEFESTAITAKELVNELNKLDKIPNIVECSEIFYQIILSKNITFYEVNLSVFKEFQTIEYIKIAGNKIKPKQRTRIK